MSRSLCGLLAVGLLVMGSFAQQAEESAPENTPSETKNTSSSQAPASKPELLETIVVSATREDQPLWQVPVAVGSISEDTLQKLKPTHPADVMGRVAGVWVNTTGGEGHMTAIRQPLSTAPVYLFLENGVPTRSTGFFNHNALYEVNLPMAAGIEVIKGPGTALHGSDAIGGVIHVTTGLPSLQRRADVSLESGANGWRRGLFSFGDGLGSGAFRADVNVTDSEGWRDGTAYQRQSANLQWLRSTAQSQWRGLLSWSNIDQDTAGTSSLSEGDYRNHPERNYTPISFREVEALRLSLAYERQLSNGQFSAIPFVRVNSMNMLPNWSLTYDPTVYEVANDSYGLMSKYARGWANGRGRLIVGADFDLSPGERFEQRITATRDAGIFTDYQVAETLYDYDVTFLGTSGYVHAEWQASDQLHLQGGLRYDRMNYDYTTNLEATDSGRWRRPADGDTSYDELSPKLGISYRLNDGLNVFAGYREAFRAPSEGQLFRQGSSEDTLGLKSVQATNVDFGIRGQLAGELRYEISAYQLEKTNDILTFQDPNTDARLVVNAGQTSHEGIEGSLQAPIAAGFSVQAAWSYAAHRYDQWRVNGTTDYSGNEMVTAPRRIGNLVLAYQPERLGGLLLSAEWRHLGSYWTNDANSQRYQGHDLFHFLAVYQLGDAWRVQARLANVSDTRYAERVSYNNFRGQEYAPGLPRSLYLNVNYRWE